MSESNALRVGVRAWFTRTPGRLVAQAHKARLDEVLPDLFGFHLLQVGRVGDVDLSEQSRIPHCIMADIDGDGTKPGSVRCRATELPFESDSIDVVILPHVLEFEDHPHDALREASRVVVPEGHLVVCGFNPRSLMGLWRLLLRKGREAPWHGRFLGVNRLRDWLALLGFDVLSLSPTFFRPPFRNPGLLGRIAFVEAIGRRATPFLGGAYLLVARKRTVAVTPRRPAWRPRRRLVGVGLAEPSARVVNGE